MPAFEDGDSYGVAGLVAAEWRFAHGVKRYAFPMIPKEGPVIVASCGNWADAVLSRRPDAITVVSLNYELAVEVATAAADKLDASVLEFPGETTAPIFTKAMDLAPNLDLILFPASGGSLLKGALAAGIPDHVDLVGVCTDIAPNFANLIDGRNRRERPGSRAPDFYTAGGNGPAHYRYPWWNDAHAERAGFHIVRESDVAGVQRRFPSLGGPAAAALAAARDLATPNTLTILS